MARKYIVYIDMDDVICDYSNAYKMSIKLNPTLKFPQSKMNFFVNLKPVKGSIKAINFLLDQNILDTYILTSPSVRNPHCYTEKRIWVEDYFNLELARKLIISSNKGLLKGDFLIDDHNAGRGQENFEGQLIHFGTKKFRNWEAVIDFLMEKINTLRNPGL